MKYARNRISRIGKVKFLMLQIIEAGFLKEENGLEQLMEVVPTVFEKQKERRKD